MSDLRTAYSGARERLRPALRIAYAAGLRVFNMTAASPDEAELWCHAVNDISTTTDPFWRDWYAVEPPHASARVKFYCG